MPAVCPFADPDGLVFCLTDAFYMIVPIYIRHSVPAADRISMVISHVFFDSAGFACRLQISGIMEMLPFGRTMVL